MRRETIDNSLIKEAGNCAAKVKSGGIILYPADTLWGLGCDATNEGAIEKIFIIKQRSGNKSLITLVSSWRMLQNVVAEIPVMAEDILELSNEPLTIIYPKANNSYQHLTSKDGKIAVRLIESGFAAELINRLRTPLISTSANLSGKTTNGRFEDVPKEILDVVDCIANPILPYKMTGQPSKMMKIEVDGRIEILR